MLSIVASPDPTSSNLSKQSPVSIASGMKLTFPPAIGGGRVRDRDDDSGGGPPFAEPSWTIGLEICRGALIVGRFFLLGPLRRDMDILLRSSDMMAASEFVHEEIIKA